MMTQETKLLIQYLKELLKIIQETKAWASSWQSWRQIKHADRYSDVAKELIASIEGYIRDPQSGIDDQDVSELTKALSSGYYYDALEVMRNELDD